MNYISWGEEYFSEATNLNKYIGKLKSQIKRGNTAENREIKRRILMLYEIMYELKCTGKRLKEGDMCEWNSYKHQFL